MAAACVICSREDVELKACGGCKEKLYCGAECQKKHWKVHKKACGKTDSIDTTSAAGAKGGGERLAYTGFEARGASAETGQMDFCSFVEHMDGTSGGSKGAAMVASVRIPCGTVVVRDSPLMVIKGEEIGVKDIIDFESWAWPRRMSVNYDKKSKVIAQKYLDLSEYDRDRYLSLADSTTNSKIQHSAFESLRRDGEVKSTWEEAFTPTLVPAPVLSPDIHIERCMKSPEGVFATNAHHVGDRNEEALFPIVCRFNHSCVPNAAYHWMEEENMMGVIASRDIEAGEEVCVRYFDPRFMSQDLRQKRTMIGWGFDCQCVACSMPGFFIKMPDVDDMTDDEIEAVPDDVWEKMGAAKASDSNRTKLTRLHASLDKVSSLSEVERTHKELQTLYRQELLLPNIFAERQLLEILLQGHASFGGPDCAKLISKLHKLSVLIDGDNHSTTQLYASWSQKRPASKVMLKHLQSTGRKKKAATK